MRNVFLETKWNGSDVKVRGKKVTGESIWDIGLVVEGQAKLLSAKNYGYLAASITTAANNRQTEIESAGKFKGKEKAVYGRDTHPAQREIKKPSLDNNVYVGSALFYAPYLEFGTIYQNAQPFLRPALALAKGETLTIVEFNSRKYFKDYLIPESTHNRHVASRYAV